MNKTAIKNFAVWARRKLISEITYKASLVGISEKGILEPLSTSTDNIQFFDIGTGKPTEIMNEEVKQRAALVARIQDKEKTSDYKTAFQFVMEEVAYTWFNRLVAIRFMEVNEYLPSKIRVLSSNMQGKAEPDMVTTPFDTDMEFSAYETDRIMQLKDENKLDELFRMLFIKQCNKLGEVLPELLEKTSDYTEYLLNISFTDKDGIVSHLVNDIEEKDFKEAVEIIGWLYQYYNTEPKEQVFANLKKNIKISKDNIPAATQLFTPDWIVRYMVENSLGRLFTERSLKSKYSVESEEWSVELEKERIADEKNIADKMGWKYYLPEAEQTPEVRKQLKTQLLTLQTEFKIETLKLIDPCMGSGHILVYAFDVFMQIYESQGYTERDAAQSIIENNLYGLDIDERAYQLAYFALMMKARKYDRRFLTRGIAPQVYCPKGYADGEEYGSLLNVDKLEPKPQEPEEVTIFNLDWEKDINIWNFRRLLSQKYDVVVTNPPYMGKKSLNTKMSSFLDEHYDKGKSEMYAAFILQCMDLTKKHGFTSMITIHTWMFISSFEKLRNHMLNASTISSMLHAGPATFEELSSFNALATSFVLRRSVIKNYNGIYIRLTDFLNSNDKISNFDNNKMKYTLPQSELEEIPGEPFVYWISNKARRNFAHSEQLRGFSAPKQGMATTNNDLFIRGWFETDINKIGFRLNSEEEAINSQRKWLPYNKGGDYRKWYGTNEYIVNFENGGEAVCAYIDKCINSHVNSKGRIINREYYFKKGLTWSLFGFENFGVRYKDAGFIFDVSGSSMFPSDDKMMYILAFLASKVAFMYLSILAPTVNFQVGNIGDLPLIFDEKIKPTIDKLSKECIDISREDWDDFEESWDFKRHPLCGRKYSSINATYDAWVKLTENRYSMLKANEEEINRLFINIYNVQDDISSEVVARDIALRRADLQRDIKSLISYAVGCMFGRYSLDVDGLAYAGGDWDDSKYSTFIPDTDNVIPITDEEYFEDDIVGLFVAFVKKVYGEETLEENLDFIAKALGNKGDTSREVIRNYFVKDFYKDHVKTYQKRPIYWLYDSGKQDGFKALIYMHRYNEDTTGKVRVDYLHKMQRTYTSEIERMQDMIDNSTNPREVAQSEKRKEKLIKQLKETKDYDEKIAHLALSRIAIDLDDGVKVNYEKVQTAQDGKMLDILGKI